MESDVEDAEAEVAEDIEDDGDDASDVEPNDATASDATATDATASDATASDATDTDTIEADTTSPDSGDSSDSDSDGADAGPRCGNGVREGSELCDGDDLGALACSALGYDGGVLACDAGCQSVITDGCSSACEPACDGRTCGPDPLCGISCGSCTDGSCNLDGQCVPTTGSSPRFISFDRNVGRITEGDTIRFTAVVTDPDGIDDLIGGTLRDAISGGAYGAFATAASEGAYQIEISWGEIHRVRPIQFSVEITRDFEAVFYDVAGNPASRTLSIALFCEDDDVACDGNCVSLDGDDHCGACFNECPDTSTCDARSCVCADGEDLCDDVCESLASVDNCGACGTQCPLGGACVEGDCACPAGFGDCDGVCVDLNTPTDCGGCAIACAAGGICVDSACTCSPGEADCAGVCESLLSQAHCGGCDIVCAFGASCTPTGCVCPTGFGVCDGECVDLTGPAQCGACGVVCATGAVCVDGECACGPDEAACDGACTSVQTTTNCGGCGLTCPALATCDDGDCVCPSGYGLCDGECVSIETLSDCGGCGRACPTTEGWLCASATCVCEVGTQSCEDGLCTNSLSVAACGGTCDLCDSESVCGAGGCRSAVETDLRINAEGLLEIYRLGEWGIVCAGGFVGIAAEVACRQLGGSFASVLRGQASTNPIAALDNFACFGTEHRLAGCPRGEWFAGTCDPFTNAIALRCDVPPAPVDCAAAATDELLIWEVAQQTVDASDAATEEEFVELRGPAGTALDGLELVQLDERGTTLSQWALDGITIPDDGLLVVGDADVTNVDLIVSGGVHDLPVSLQLRACDGRVVDAIAIGDFDLVGPVGAWAGEGVPRQAVRPGKTVGRRAGDAPDTGDNASDFAVWTVPTPGELNEASVRPNSFPISVSGRWPAAGTSLYPPSGDCTGAEVNPYNQLVVRFTNTEATPVSVRGTSSMWVVIPGGFNEPPRTTFFNPHFGAYSSPPDPANLLLGCELFSPGVTQIPQIDIVVEPGADMYFALHGRGTYNHNVYLARTPE